MKTRAICFVLLCVTLTAAGFAAAHVYQAGKIVKVEKLGSHAPSGGTDAPLREEVTAYHVSVQLGDKIYVCSYDTRTGRDISWIEGKDVQARVSGRVMYVKTASGKDAKGSIESTLPAGNP